MNRVLEFLPLQTYHRQIWRMSKFQKRRHLNVIYSAFSLIKLVSMLLFTFHVKYE